MESDTEDKDIIMFEQDVPHGKQIDPGRARFPCCIVWTPLPVVSWLLPFIGHVGIGREDGVIVDFAGPCFVCVDNFAFGAVTRYIQIDKGKCSITPDCLTKFRSEEEFSLIESGRNQYTWDDALLESTQQYQHRTYNILTCNCHSFVANNLNRLEFRVFEWWVECGELGSVNLVEGSMGEYSINGSILCAICVHVLYGDHIWRGKLLKILGVLCIRSCWMVSLWYVLFQKHYTTLAALSFVVTCSHVV
ncbi:RTF1 homolog-like protein [Tanacetum coccineum]